MPEYAIPTASPPTSWRNEGKKKSVVMARVHRRFPLGASADLTNAGLSTAPEISPSYRYWGTKLVGSMTMLRLSKRSTSANMMWHNPKPALNTSMSPMGNRAGNGIPLADYRRAIWWRHLQPRWGVDFIWHLQRARSLHVLYKSCIVYEVQSNFVEKEDSAKVLWKHFFVVVTPCDNKNVYETCFNM